MSERKSKSSATIDDDARVACSHGLHVGSSLTPWTFARGKVVIVKVNPKDVVSVPHDCNCQKLRTCAYTAVAEHIGTLETAESQMPETRIYGFACCRQVRLLQRRGADTYDDENEYDDESDDEPG